MKVLPKLASWFFALDHTNYARWLPVHIKDLLALEKDNPALYKELQAGHFVTRKSCNSFSAIALDHAHEQMNGLLKNDGGMIGLTENPEAMRKFVLSGPEMANMVSKFEDASFNNTEKKGDPNNHHNANEAAQTAFLTHKKALESVMTDLGNPFLEENEDLYDLESKKICPSSSKDTVFTIEDCGVTQYQNFVSERLESNKVSLKDPIKLNKFPLFKTGVKKNTNLNLKSQVTASKNDCSLFRRLYIATSANRPNDLGEFFSHENQEYPPSISVMGKLRTSDSKSDLTKYLSNLSEECTADSVPIVRAKILDGAVIVHMLEPGTPVTFGDYISNISLNYVRKESATVNRLDLVFDRYLENSLKYGTRQKRGGGSRIRVTLSTKVPEGWENFLRHADNKTALFELLAESI
ncbi:unnamed protein product [Phaedon cochleariae]|uniref:Uncharacterized protein n=1 Tax=Phaedon cochleariae TaxID=80249 RepID=A0A9P0GVA0_PHACE|nr:unnamed protein product [Phaedon cochleariae]